MRGRRQDVAPAIHILQARDGAAVLAAGTILAGPATAEVKSLEIIAPAAPGGGWDQHARSVQQVLQNQKLVPNVQVVNIPGAGGTIGLAQFVTAKKRTPTLLVGGQIMVGAIITNKSAVTLDQVTPLARLTGEYSSIVVPADSPLKSLKDLLDKFKAEPGSVSWGGGSAGGSDQILAGPDRQGSRRRAVQGQLHRDRRRRRGAGGRAGRPYHGGGQRLQRVRAADPVGQAAGAGGFVAGASGGRRYADPEGTGRQPGVRQLARDLRSGRDQGFRAQGIRRR